ncbi:ankyrin repeat domain-containing protein [Treponema primitia]|uniref:ankyrin repeat domain-containing protein n=1 Tax=Treponema primitia TaxID=88058 RepID=UPI0039805C9E
MVKIVMLHDGDGRKIAGDLLKQIKSQKINGEALLLEGAWESGEPHLGEALADATHVMAIFPNTAGLGPSGPSWFSFAAGFARGAHLPLVSYGEGALSLAPQLTKDLALFKTDAEFLAYLAREAEEWTREHTLKQARISLLEKGIPVTADSLGRCIAEKNDEAAALFLQTGFSADTLDKNGVPLLCLAARSGAREIVKLLLKNGATVNLLARDRGGSALIDAALGKHSDILGDLLNAGADVNVKSKDGQSAIIIAVGLNDEPTVELLLKAGANVDEPDSLGASARKYVVLFNRPGMVKLFQEYACPKI